ncbi:unnamed protein product [Ceratitis capitata]|uniref:(Mediterranean fruit fly) hypothetical protein n=1 Tax=Ceratitis capitata TaxID=7213 RepID=A0A811VLR5_CERCA|nr:unnamed protein product [Ceratitis capitata]
MTYISPCHAGCKKQYRTATGRKIYYDCTCIPSNNFNRSLSTIDERLTALNLKSEVHITNNENISTTIMPNELTTTTVLPDELLTTTTDFPDDWATTMDSTALPATSDMSYPELTYGGQARTGACPVNCYAQFVTFLSVMCCLKFVGATGRASNFLVSVRCVPEKDKTAAMGFGMMMMSMLAFIPSPIFFGWVLDRICLVWGKTCTNKGNCWLYDPESLRYTLNITASVFVAIGALFDWGVWYYVKDLQIFDEEVKEVEMKIVQHEEEVNSVKDMEV